MAQSQSSALQTVLAGSTDRLLGDWIDKQLASSGHRPDLIDEAELRTQSREFLNAFRTAIAKTTSPDVHSADWQGVRDILGQLSTARAQRGFSPAETATFVMSLKQPLFERLRESLKDAPQALADQIWSLTELIDQLALYTAELYQKTRESIIARQQQELLELSTPVVSLWDDILALPIIGALDSQRTQTVMESLLQRIVESGSSIAILDITGVPTVDTLTAQHLLKTVAAARLMGADCIISGIRPQIAQTMVHLGIDLSEVVTKATLADAFKTALARTGATIVAAASSLERR